MSTRPWGLVVLILGSCSGDAGETGSPWFEEVAEQSGVDFTHRRAPVSRFDFPEIMGSGLALLDYDGDGALDLYCVQSGDVRAADGRDVPGNRLFRNRGDGAFVDVTEEAGVGDSGYGMGCATGDYDGDGDLDLYVTNWGPNVLYRNEGGGVFTDVTTPAGVGDSGWGTSAAFVDYDGDGDLDLFIVNYVEWTLDLERDCTSDYGERDYCSPARYQAPAPDVLYRNDGAGSFEDVSREVGLGRAPGTGLGVACADFDGDGRIELFVANDGMRNQLWTVQPDGSLRDEALLKGCAVNMSGTTEASMGVAAVDVEDDGDWDLFMTHLHNQTHTLYLNEDGAFADRTSRSGLARPTEPSTGFGIGFADFDCDGRLDLYVANGRVQSLRPRFRDDDPYAEPDQVFRGIGAGRFEEVPGAAAVTNSRGAAFGDIDGDGDVDVAVVDNGARLRLLRNVVPGRGHWIQLRVVDERGSDALGARVEVRAGGRSHHRLVQTTYSYCSANDPRVHVGLGDAQTVAEILVTWPDGAREAFGPFDADASLELQRGRSR